MAIKAVIFDCFGVLAEDAWLPFKRQYIGDNKDVADAITNLGMQNEYGVINNDQYFAQSAKLIGVDEQVLRTVLGKRVPNLELFTFIQDVLKPNYKIGLLSNANYDVLTELFTPEQAALFDASTLSFESKMVKPDPQMFALMATKLGVELEDCLFIDDIERYCVAAEALGMITIVYATPVQTVAEITQLLQLQSGPVV